jgi:hypothetical protein
MPLMSSTTKQTALTQWQTRTSAECLKTSRPSGAARAGRAEESDVNPVSSWRFKASIFDTLALGRVFRSRIVIFVGRSFPLGA